MSKIKFSSKRYWALTRGGIMEGLSFRTSYFITIIGNFLYLIVIYFLWKAIYASSPSKTVGGMTFYDTLIYLVLAAALFNLMNSFLIFEMGRDIQSGKIILNLLKPMDFQVYMFFQKSGGFVISFLMTFLPTFLLVYFFTKGSIDLGVNLLYFIISIFIAMVINYCIDLFVGTIALYTHSIWGINIMKEVVVLLLSGATVPLAFFPETLRTVVNYLPFQAIYNTPLHILTDSTLVTKNYFWLLGLQLMWATIMIVFSRCFWKFSQKVITVNGG